uniref:Thioredoxin domain-containing protein n=1 Tax=Acrobeloides nanus TaxID=290746 RepID=A0A914DZP7_9BILA
MAPKFHELSEEFIHMVFIKVDTDELTDVSEMFNIQLMPTFIFIKNGKQVDRLESSRENELRKMIEARV